MIAWQVTGILYQAVWVNPKHEWAGLKQVARDVDHVDVILVDEQVPAGQKLASPPVMRLAAYAKLAQKAVGDVLQGRPRIDFLRQVKQYPEGLPTAMAYERPAHLPPKCAAEGMGVPDSDDDDRPAHGAQNLDDDDFADADQDDPDEGEGGER